MQWQSALPLISAEGPAIHDSGLSRPTSRCERFSHMRVTAETDEVIGALQVAFVPAEPGVVAKIEIVFQTLGKLCVVAVINPGVRDNRVVLRTRRGLRRRRGGGNESPRVGPVRGKIAGTFRGDS